MKKKIPHIAYHPKNETLEGFEIVPIQKISQTKAEFKHNPETPHQLDFYNLIFFTNGSGRHLIDFNWFPVKKGSVAYLAKEQVNAFDLSGDLDGFCLIFTEAYFVQCFRTLPKEFVFRLFNPELQSPIANIAEGSDFLTYFDLLNLEYNNDRPFNKKSILDSLFVILISKLEEMKQKQSIGKFNDSKISYSNASLLLLKSIFLKSEVHNSMQAN